MSPLLVFVRHGESEANVARVISNRESPYPLTERGRGQAADAAERLRQYRVTRILSSPLVRAKQTATVIGEALGVTVHLREELREFDCGVGEGRSDESAWRLHAALFDAWLLRGEKEASFEGGEDLHAIADRLGRLVAQCIIEPAPDDGATVFVGHGGVYRAALPFVLANVDPAFAHAHPLGHSDMVLAEVRSATGWCRSWGAHDLSRG